MLRDSDTATLTRNGGQPAHSRMTTSTVLRAYRRMAPVYDWVFGGMFQQGRRMAIDALAARPGERVLEVGIGTGIALRHWPAHARVTGIDISPEMLVRAREACQRHALHNVDVQIMDAQAMTFADDTFHKVAAMYVVSVAPDLSALLREMKRVCKPGGKICIVNHFEHPNQLLRGFEKRLSAYAGFLGFDSALPIERITKQSGLKILRTRRVNFGGYWWLIEAENAK